MTKLLTATSVITEKDDLTQAQVTSSAFSVASAAETTPATTSPTTTTTSSALITPASLLDMLLVALSALSDSISSACRTYYLCETQLQDSIAQIFVCPTMAQLRIAGSESG
eukprot:NODE_5673_length_651_cov_6.956811_g5287_i0.p1 GENE.NODE_5673_length_651_cov_6.956811_g5287_i0~~NODE_5673_length_651_cov_6.956811_g5287_i0.p1  ORF type:complete len:111 (+),score=19.09 NODE_5673_length_651_cov_6.956811_g5287_i0:90-422(+)